jgi:hypothetical protein
MTRAKIIILILLLIAGALGAEPVLNEGDSLSVWVVGEPELSADVFIGEDGCILMPLIGYVKLAGLSLEQAKAAVEAAYRDGYLQKPMVHITIRVQTKSLGAQGVKGQELDQEVYPQLGVVHLDEELVPDEVAALFEKQAQIAKEIELRILDGHTKLPIARAQVQLPGKRARRSDKNGFVRIPASDNLFNQSGLAKVSYKNYQTEELELNFAEPVVAKTLRLYPVGYEKPAPPNQLTEVVGALNTAINADFLEARVSLNVENKDIKTILNGLLAQFDVALAMEDHDQRYDLTATDVTMRELLKNFLLSRGYQYTVNDTELVVIVPTGFEQKTVKEMLFRDLSLHEALRILAKLMKINLFITPQVADKTVNFYVDYLNLNDLLELLLETNGLQKHRRGINTYIITPKKTFNQ